MKKINYFKVIDQTSGKNLATVSDLKKSVELKGFSLLQQFRLNNDELLFVLTNADPWDSKVAFNLVSSNLTLIEWIALGPKFGGIPTSFRPHESRNEMEVDFSAPGKSWRITIHPQATKRYLPKIGWYGSRAPLRSYRLDFKIL